MFEVACIYTSSICLHPLVCYCYRIIITAVAVSGKVERSLNGSKHHRVTVITPTERPS